MSYYVVLLLLASKKLLNGFQILGSDDLKKSENSPKIKF